MEILREDHGFDNNSLTRFNARPWFPIRCLGSRMIKPAFLLEQELRFVRTASEHEFLGVHDQDGG